MSASVATPSAATSGTQPGQGATGAAAAELSRQVEVLLERGYPAMLGIEPEAFVEALAPLADGVGSLDLAPAGSGLPVSSTVTTPEDYVPFVLVVAGSLPLAEAAAQMRLGTRPATLMLTPEELPGYRPIDGLEVPDAGGPVTAYLLTDIDTGSELCNVTPETALGVIRGRGRTPLTIAEGIALVTQRPDMLRTNKCFSLLGSRRGDQRVPAVWISQKAPKLGWCWDRNPHTWLGSASAGSRLV
ncbi:DUF5701 family protein [Sanguibacter suarezii]|uniref:DUF5701 family protein n=1 Tax=Sanguibacter suarezii TaxID=60921 RepID=UPI000836C2BD|nr:DUF5701 family protein [Sanguibacter suarezii]